MTWLLGVVRKWVSVSKLSDFSDGGYEYDDTKEICSFRCNRCYQYTDVMVRSGILASDKCEHCGELI